MKGLSGRQPHAACHRPQPGLILLASEVHVPVGWLEAAGA